MEAGTQTANTGDATTAKNEKKSAAPRKDNHEEGPAIQNRRARHEYDVIDTLECGIVLTGTEVKSLRAGKASLEDAYARMRDEEVWLMGADIQEYTHARFYNHEGKRPRKLLLHRREIRKFASQAYEKGLTLVPLKLYFKRGRAKVLIGLCRGRKVYDKREILKKKTMQREIERSMRRGMG